MQKARAPRGWVVCCARQALPIPLNRLPVIAFGLQQRGQAQVASAQIVFVALFL